MLCTKNTGENEKFSRKIFWFSFELHLSSGVWFHQIRAPSEDTANGLCGHRRDGWQRNSCHTIKFQKQTLSSSFSAHFLRSPSGFPSLFTEGYKSTISKYIKKWNKIRFYNSGKWWYTEGCCVSSSSETHPEPHPARCVVFSAPCVLCLRKFGTKFRLGRITFKVQGPPFARWGKKTAHWSLRKDPWSNTVVRRQPSTGQPGDERSETLDARLRNACELRGHGGHLADRVLRCNLPQQQLDSGSLWWGWRGDT